MLLKKCVSYKINEEIEMAGENCHFEEIFSYLMLITRVPGSRVSNYFVHDMPGGKNYFIKNILFAFRITSML